MPYPPRFVSDAPEPGFPAGLEREPLARYLADHLLGSHPRTLTARLIAGGRSNLTYEIDADGRRWVLRRPPLGHVLPTAHDMAREYRVLRALCGTEVPVPRPLALCEDPDVIGAPFYVMEWVEGVVLRDPGALAALGTDGARRCSEELVRVLVAIHDVNIDAVGLSGFGRPVGYLERQLRRWSEQWERSKTRDLPEIDELARRLRAALPTSPAPTVVHGDYRLDNVMVAPEDPGRIVAVLDWEMSTLGDPLADLGLFLLYWGQADAQRIATGAALAPTPGLYSRDEIVEAYARRTGRDVSHLDWYLVFAAFKLAIIVEGIHARFRMGKTVGEGFEAMGAMVTGLVTGALATAEQSPIPALRGR